VQLFRTKIWCCMQSIRADLGKSFRPISLFGETIVLSHIVADFVGGILWGASSSLRGCANPPGVKIQCLRDQIRDPALTHFSLEARVFLLEQFPTYSDGLNFWTSFPAGSGYRTSSESHIFADPSVHASDLLSSSDHGYFFMLFDCIPVLIHKIWLTFIFYISSRLLYFNA
jgi:hypothetical protein